MKTRKKTVGIIGVLIMIFLSGICADAQYIIKDVSDSVKENTYNTPEQISGVFSSTANAFVGESDFYYDECDFTQSSYNYSHNLAKMSLRLSMSAFANMTEGYNVQYKDAKILLNTLGFGDVSWNYGYTEKPEINSIAVIAGNKKIICEDGNYTLIAAAIRGGGYGAEWGGNFNLGHGDLHEGFKIARDDVLEFLSGYVSDNEITGNVKIWITGYSRAAATANITAAYLDDNDRFFGENVSLKPENIYAYCFETPAGVHNPSSDLKYDNIFSIVNPDDFVPMYTMESWDYGRYGRTLYLPSEETNNNYQELITEMYTRYDSYVKDEYKTNGGKPIEDFSDYAFAWSIEKIASDYGFYLKKNNGTAYGSMGAFLRDTADVLAEGFENPSQYADNQQGALIYIGKTIIGEGKSAEFIRIFREELTSRISFIGVMGEIVGFAMGSDKGSGIIYDSAKAAFNGVGVEVDDETLGKFISMTMELASDNKLETLIGNFDIIVKGHYPELCLAWLDTIDETMYTEPDRDDADENEILVLLNGSKIDFDQPPVIQNDRTLVPLRAIFEALGAKVDWNGETQTVTALKGDKTITLTIGSNILYVNSSQVILDVPAQIINDRTLVPVRAIAESFDCTVDWDGNTQTVNIIIV